MLVRTSRYMPGYTVTQPLGIMYLGAALREHGYRNIRLIDMRPDRMSVEQLMGLVSEFRPRLLGLSSLSYEAPTVTEIIEATRRVDPTIHICLGGPLPSSMKEEVFETMPADSACIGEGDATICDLVDCLAESWTPGSQPPVPQPPNLDQVTGIVYRSGSEVIKNSPPCEFIHEPRRIAQPRVGHDRYHQIFPFLRHNGFQFFPEKLPLHVRDDIAWLPLPLRVLPQRSRQEISPP